MNKKIIIFILALPILLLLISSNVANLSALYIDIPVSQITTHLYINNENKDSVMIDLAFNNEDVYLYSVLGPKAVNKTSEDITYEIIDTNTNEQSNAVSLVDAELSINGEKIKAKKVLFNDIASIKITTKIQTVSDYVNINIYSSMVLGFNNIYIKNKDNIEVNRNNIKMGDILYFSATTYPSNITPIITYTSSNPYIIEINPTSGIAKCLNEGEVIIYLEIENSLVETINSISLNVKNNPITSNISINGKEINEIELIKGIHSYTFSGFIHTNVSEFNINNPILIKENSLVTHHLIEEIEYLNENLYRFSITIYFDTNISLILDQSIIDFHLNDGNNLNDDFVSRLIITFLDFEDSGIKVLGDSNVRVGEQYRTSYSVVSSDELSEYEYILNYDSAYVNSVNTIYGIRYYFIKSGTTILEFNVCLRDSLNELYVIGTINFEVTIYDPYLVLDFIENSTKIKGIALEYEFGYYDIDNNIINYDLSSSLYAEKTVDYRNILFSTNDENIAYVINENNKPYLKIQAPGLITIIARCVASIIFNFEIITQASLTLRLVDGVNVSCEDDLVNVVNSSRKVVLTANISLGEKYFNYSNNQYTIKPGINFSAIFESQKINGTFDHTFYTNTSRPYNIYYLLEFKNDVYGNSYCIDTHFISYLLTKISSTNSLFKGPLDLVSLGQLASVKAQDNISFLVRTPNVIIDNVELKALDINRITLEDNQFNINELNYTGTVLELMENNIKVVNSKIGYGRVASRVYGKYIEHDYQTYQSLSHDDKIEVSFNSSILSISREFILKIGTNEAILGNVNNNASNEIANKYNEASPYLKKEDGSNYLLYNDPSNLANLDDEYFVDNYLKTIVNVVDCVLIDSGLFSIGIESKFAGPVLDGHSIGIYQAEMQHWNNLAGTSYAALLKLGGEVRIFDWKRISNIDSSTLIEVASNAPDTLKNYLSFNLNQILLDVYNAIQVNSTYYNSIPQNIKNKIANYVNALDYNYELKEYMAHGGIAFYGGGKNYSMILNEATNLINDEFLNIKISLPDMQYLVSNSTLYSNLTLAAGKEDFNFYTFSKNSAFNYVEQLNQYNRGIIINPYILT